MHLCPKHKQYKSANTVCPGCEAEKVKPITVEPVKVTPLELQLELEQLQDELEDVNQSVKIYMFIALLGWAAFVMVLLFSLSTAP